MADQENNIPQLVNTSAAEQKPQQPIATASLAAAVSSSAAAPSPVPTMKNTTTILKAPGNLEHKRQRIYGKKMSVLTIDNKKYLIGVQIAHLLQRETYNLYRSMKVKNLTIARASPEQVDYLLKTNVVKPGTRSITFVPIDQGLSYINEEINKVGLRKKKDKSNSPAKPFTIEKTKLKPLGVTVDSLTSKMASPPASPIAPLAPTTLVPLATRIQLPNIEVDMKNINMGDPFAVLCAAAEAEYSRAQKAGVPPVDSKPVSTQGVTSNFPITNTLPVPLSGQPIFPLNICGVSSQRNSLFEYYEQLNKQVSDPIFRQLGVNWVIGS
jgi:hypothetical protein